MTPFMPFSLRLPFLGAFFLAVATIGIISAQERSPRRSLPDLPETVTSFGAAVLGEHLYIYSGHLGGAHEFTRENYSNHFRRLNLRWSGDWEELEMQDPVQGGALVAWGDAVYRIGGVFSRNPPGEAPDMHSTDTFARYRPSEGTWTALPPLPEPRSSFDAAVHAGRIYVVGGWTLDGNPADATWAERNYVIDLEAETPEWVALPDAPFRHRALAVAVSERFLYAIGGMTDGDAPTGRVFVFDLEKETWSEGPGLPGDSPLRGFGASAFGIGDTVWASGIDGRVYGLREGATAWRDTGHDLEIARFFHRLLPGLQDKLLFVGGTAPEGDAAAIETVDLTLLQAETAARRTAPPIDSVDASGQRSWPGFRGTGQSISTARALPVQWSDEENVAWSVALPGYGQSSPAVWQDRVFVTSVEGEEKETLRVDCLDLESGERLWEATFEASQTVARSRYVSQAAPTPVADGSRVYAFFESGDVIALTHGGDEVWRRSLTDDYGPIGGNHGLGSSPALSSAGLVLLVDHDGPSYLICLDRETGKNRWKVDREKRVSWSSPVVTDGAWGEEVLLSSNGVAESFDAETGQRNWVFTGIEGNTVASPSASAGIFVVGSSEKGESCAIRQDGEGDVTGSHLAWVAEDASSSFGSPLIHGNAVYFVNRAGVAFCNDLATGKCHWSLRLPASTWASPIAAGQRIYFFSTNGTTTILQANPEEPVQLGAASLTTEDRVYGVAAVDGNLLFRMESRIVCVRAP